MLELTQSKEGLKWLYFFSSSGGAIPHGEHKHVGRYGWRIATDDRILWKGRGPVVRYPDTSSYRTEHGAHSLYSYTVSLYITESHPLRIWYLITTPLATQCRITLKSSTAMTAHGTPQSSFGITSISDSNFFTRSKTSCHSIFTQKSQGSL